MLRRRLAMLGALMPFLLAIAVACSEEAPAAKSTSNPPPPVGGLEDSVCPVAAPDPGQACLLPDGTTCAFGACNSAIAQCLGGAWHYSGNQAQNPPCPTDFPLAGAVCPSCWAPDASCVYGSSDCSAPDASANTTVASCPGGHWILTTFPCAISDAGADVQRDAELDAD
jgi:hypothetical protein